MSRIAGLSTPKYRKHRATGQAVVSIAGHDHYLGPHGTKASRLEYDRLIGEWLAAGRPTTIATATDRTVAELIHAYKRFAEHYYRKNGKITNEVTAIASAAKIVRELYANEFADAFGPLKLQVVQQAMIRAGWSRRHINKQVGRVVRMFSWGVSQELVQAGVAQALREVKGLHKGRTDAREAAPVPPVADTVVDATLPHLPAVVADMVRFCKRRPIRAPFTPGSSGDQAWAVWGPANVWLSRLPVRKLRGPVWRSMGMFNSPG